MATQTDSAESSTTSLPFAAPALAISVLAACVGAGALLLDAVTPAAGSDPVTWASVVYLAAIVAIPLVVLVAVRIGRSAFAGGVLCGNAAIAAAWLVFDAVLLRRPIDANRFELLRPTSAANLTAAAGAWASTLAHLLFVLAGVAGARLLGRVRDAGEPAEESSPIAMRAGAGWSVLTVLAAAALAWSVFPAQWASADSALVVRPAVESGRLILTATAVLAVAVLAVTALALAAQAVLPAAGAAVGAGIGGLSILGSRWAAAADPSIDATGAVLVGTIAAGLLVLLGGVLPLIAGRRGRRSAQSADLAGESVQRRLSAIDRAGWNVAAGCAAVCTAVLLGVGALLPVLSVPDGVAEPDVAASRVALLGAAVLLIGAVWLFLSEFATTVRPAVGVLTAASLLGAGGVLQVAVEGRKVASIGFGPGAWTLVVAVLAAGVTAVLLGFAGSAERDELDRSEEPRIDPVVAGVCGVAALLGVLGLALPLYSGAGADATSFALPWGWDTWIQAMLAVVIVAVAVVAVRSRPARAVALLAGAAVAMVVYLAELPLTRNSVPAPGIGPGAPPAVLAILAFAAAAVLVTRRADSSEPVRQKSR